MTSGGKIKQATGEIPKKKRKKRYRTVRVEVMQHGMFSTKHLQYRGESCWTTVILI